MNIEDVRSFWNLNPLFHGESSFETGTKDFFEEHHSVVVKDCFAGKLDEKIFKLANKDAKIIDIGCGVGFWIIEFGKRGYKNINACDLTEKAVEMAQKRCSIYNIAAKLTVDNAEDLKFEDSSFDHVNCQGVIHHTPNTERCLAEFHRILRTNGTASLSVYYRNIFLRAWPIVKWISHALSKMGFKLLGRGRENIFASEDADEIVRLYDGANNPIGKSYTKDQFLNILSPHFEVQDVYYHFFPARSLPFKIPKFLHKIFDRYLPFMIYVNVRKK